MMSLGIKTIAILNICGVDYRWITSGISKRGKKWVYVWYTFFFFLIIKIKLITNETKKLKEHAKNHYYSQNVNAISKELFENNKEEKKRRQKKRKKKKKKKIRKK